MLAMLSLLAALATEGKVERVAVLELAAANVDLATAQTLGEFFTAEVQKLGFVVITTSEVATLLGYERQKQLLGCEESSSCIAEIAGALGADLIATGSIGRVGETYALSLKALDARTGTSIGRISETTPKLDALFEIIREGVPRVFATRVPQAAPAAEAKPAAAAPPIAARAEPLALPAPPPIRPRRAIWPAWTAVAGGALLALAGVYAAVTFDDEQRAYEARFESEGVLDDARLDSARGYALAANVLFVAGAAAGVTGVVLFVWP